VNYLFKLKPFGLGGFAGVLFIFKPFGLWGGFAGVLFEFKPFGLGWEG